AVTTFVGFARTYYLKNAYHTPALPTLVHLHAMLFTSWIALLTIQTGLVPGRRTDLHRRLGMAGLMLSPPPRPTARMWGLADAHRSDGGDWCRASCSDAAWIFHRAHEHRRRVRCAGRRGIPAAPESTAAQTSDSSRDRGTVDSSGRTTTHGARVGRPWRLRRL